MTTMNITTTCNDDSFGPTVSGCRDGFDFTLLFEQSILSICPSALLILCATPRILQLYRRSIKTTSTPISSLKAFATLAFLGIQISLLVLWTSHPATRASVPAAVLYLLVGIAISGLSILEDSRAVQPSTILSVYLLISLLCDITIVRTLYLRHETRAILGLSTASIALKTILLLLETHNKRTYLKKPYNEWSKEATSGVINRSFFWWLNPLFITGFRHILVSTNLSPLDPDLLSTSLEESMSEAWARFSSSGGHSLVYASTWCLRWPIFMTIFPRLCLIGLNYAQPFLIQSAVLYIENPNASKNDGYGLVGATIFIYLGLAIFTAHFQHYTYRAITMFRGAMVSLIYSKALELHAGAFDNTDAITLMSTDIDRIAGSVASILDLWARVIEIAIGIWLLETQLGWVCIVPIIAVIVCTYGAVKVAALIGPAQMVWMGSIQTRVGMTSSILSSMKSIKIMGLSETLSSLIQKQRVRELDLSVKFRWLSICRNVLSVTPTLLGPLLTFAVFAIQASAQHTDGLSTSKAFTSLAIISLVTTPAQSLLTALPAINAALSCFDRIQAFLLAESWRDNRSERHSASSEFNDSKMIQLQELTPNSQSIPAVTVEGLNVRLSKDSPLAVANMNFRVANGSLTMVIGVIGSGKSTLLKAILGELKPESGRIEVSSTRIAYCSQTTWIPNATIRQIVCGHLAAEVDHEFYRTVIHACAFDEDILQLPNGHDTVVGSRGVMLSGGQKQRLALARAVYSRTDIVLLDDILSALDSRTESLILERLLGKTGLFHKLSCTVILATHTIRHLPQADQIIVLGVNGQISQLGNFDDLRTQEGFVSSLVLPDTLPEKSKSSPKDPVKKKPLPKALQGPSANDIADLARRTGDISLYKYYFASIGWKISLALLLTVCLNTLGSSFPQVWLKWYTDGTIRGVALFTCIYAVFVLTSLFMTAASMVVMFLKAIPKSGAGIHQTLLNTVMHAPQYFLDKNDSGVILNKFSQDMSLVDSSLPAAVIITLQALFNCIAMAALISLGSSYMGLTTIGLIVSLYFVQNIYLRTSRQMRFLDLEAKSPLYTHFLETLEGLTTIRAFGWQQAFKSTSNIYLDLSQQPYYLLYCIQRWLTLVLQLLIGAMAVLVVGLAVDIRSTTNAGNLGIALTTILSFNTNVQFLLTWWTTLETSLGAISRTRSFEQETPREDKPGEDRETSQYWPEQGEIVLNGVSASYGNSWPALSHISLQIKAGEKIGICGRTGSGKSSLLSTFLRSLDLEDGTIFIDGIDIATVSRSLIRTKLIAVPQEGFVLPGTVRFNADPSTMISDDEIITAMTKVHLWPTLSSRGGLDAIMSKEPLSHGQQQLFSLGRALLRKNQAKILILDEATSSMDVQIDEVIREVVLQEFREHTVIVIAHRLGSIVDLERVVVLDAGEVVEVGVPRELLKMRESKFNALYLGEGNVEVK